MTAELFTPDHPEVLATAERNGGDPTSIATALRTHAAIKEARALKEWQRDRVGEAPATPNLTAIKEGLVMKTATKTATRTASSTVVEYTKNGQRIPSQRPWTLSRVAWFYTAGIESKDSPRTNVAGLEKVLAKLGVADPRQPGWEVTLPNGVVLGAVAPGTAVDAKPAPAKKVAAEKRAVTKSTGGKTLLPSPKARVARKSADTRKRNAERKAS